MDKRDERAEQEAWEEHSARTHDDGGWYYGSKLPGPVVHTPVSSKAVPWRRTPRGEPPAVIDGLSNRTMYELAKRHLFRMPALAQWHMGNSGDFETAIGVLPPLDYGLPPCLELSVSVGAIDQVEAWGVIGDMSRQAFAKFAADVAKRVGADS